MADISELKVGDRVRVAGSDTYPRFMHVPGVTIQGLIAKGMVGVITKIYHPEESAHLDRSDGRDVVVAFDEPKKWKAHFEPDEITLAGAEEEVTADTPAAEAPAAAVDYSLADIDLCNVQEGAACVDQYMTPIATATVLHPAMPMREAATLLYNQKITGAPVVDGGRLVGVLTQFDFLNQEVGAVASGQASLDSGNWETAIKKSMSTSVGGAMSKPVAISVSSDMAQVAALMLKRRFNHVPVVQADGTLVGILTSQDVLKHVLQRLDEDGAAGD